jgi:predicted GNAT superfamily acetyltransferase
MTGVSTKLQGRSVGFALKQHQRAWALDQGISLVAWTFDPLVRRNAYFNISKLGASVTEYYASFYGEMNDGINDKDETDRVLIEWDLDSPRAIEASISRLREPDLSVLEREGAAVALAVGEDEAPIEKRARGDILLVGVPEDIVEVRQRDEVLGQRWRLALRDVLGNALNDGFVTAGMTRSGFYVLRR